MIPSPRRRLLPLLCGALLAAPSLARATVFLPPGEDMGPRSSHHALGPRLSLGLEKAGLSPGFGLQYQAGSLKEYPFFRAALMGAPFQRRYGAELGASFHLGGRRSPVWWRYRVTADALLTLERGQRVPALAPGVSVTRLFADYGRSAAELGLELRAVLPPWHWESNGPRVELSLTFLWGLHNWPRDAHPGEKSD